MTWAEKYAIRISGFTVFMAVAFPGILIYMYSQSRQQIESYGWPETAGVVESLVVKPRSDDNKNVEYYGRVVYRYKVNDQEYTTDLTDLGPGAMRTDQKLALEDLSRFRPGDKVVVYYDPTDPGVGVLSKGVSEIHKNLLIACTIGTVVSYIACLFIIGYWLRRLFRPSRTPSEPGKTTTASDP